MNFSHGGDITAFASQLNCDKKDIIDLSSNINFIKPDIELDFNKLEISSYPNYDKLYKSVSNLYDVDSEQIELFNGGSSAIFSLFRHFDTRHVQIYSPAYLEYKKAAVKHNYTIELINRFTDLNKYIADNSLVVFVNPSTPEGSFYHIETLMEKWISKKCTILIDESFLDFTQAKSIAKYLKNYDKLYILKSMTKFYSSAGIRVGTVISTKANIIKLKENEPLWKISQFDSCYIQEVLKDKKFVKISKAVNTANTEYLKRILKEFKYTNHIFNTSANFVMVELKTINAQQFQEVLKPYKIMIRDCSNFDFLDDSFVRIAVKSQKDLTKFKEALECL
ncbi:MAG: aminotransferase class I/II-fold pyridoxal phosphate-dependent enzyme [Campylobacterota bacterium]|nr:aminotransferase class I/II-fold pyridoxal phosphate-dependent enzyme [Campylobacterota bacterium]